MSNHDVMDVDTINAICYDLAHDIDLNEKAWLIPALHSHVQHLAQQTLTGYNFHRATKLIDQWIAVRQGKLNPVPRSMP
jgi:hypothetical protein